MNKNNYTLLCDFYELTMGNGYFETGKKDQICYFDIFFRRIPDGGGFAIAAGLEQAIDYIKRLSFSESDLGKFFKAGMPPDNIHKLFCVHGGFLCFGKLRLDSSGSFFQMCIRDRYNCALSKLRGFRLLPFQQFFQ